MGGTKRDLENEAAIEDGDNTGNEGERKRGKKKQKTREHEPSHKVRYAINIASSKKDLHGALEVYRTAKNDGVNILPHVYTVLLHLCGLDESNGGAQLEAGSAGSPKLTSCEIFELAQEIFDNLMETQTKAGESAWTELARAAAKHHSPQQSLQVVEKMKEAGVSPKLRSFSPALCALCDQGKLSEALAVEGQILEAGLEISQVEYCKLLAACTQAHATDASSACAAASGLLSRLRLHLTSVGTPLSDALSLWFQTSGGFTIGQTEVSQEGVCQATGARLQSHDLTAEERATLAAGIAKLALERESKEQFSSFQQWLKDNPGVRGFVDGANVGMYKQNIQDGCFNFFQIDKLMKYMASRPEARGKRAPLVVLHERRTTHGPAKEESSEAVLKRWRHDGWLYTTPRGSNDDWYWLYGAVVVGEDSFLVTNDEMRDHIFQMLPDPKLFYKWKDRHQVRFDLENRQVVCMFPRPYSNCIQELPDGSWYFPLEGDEDEKWLYAKRN